MSTDAERMPSRRLLPPGSQWDWSNPDPEPPAVLAGGSDGAAVIYDAVAGKVLKCGGARGGIATRKRTALFKHDHGSNDPWWTSNTSMDMDHGRIYPNLVLLPTQEIVVIGGIDGCGWNEAQEYEVVWEAEVFDPSTEQWSLSGAGPMDDPRWYHSSALLLRDGRVLCAGGNNSATQHNGYQYGADHSAQVLRPAYFAIDAGVADFTDADPPPDEIEHDQQPFQFKYTHTRQNAFIDKVALLRLGAPTHSYDQEQRYVPLQFSEGQGRELTVTPPANGWIAPPGYYMLWLVDDAGVPRELAHCIKAMPAP